MVNSLRVLLVESDPGESGRIAECLEKASHAVLPASGLDEAAQALQLQQFDAVMVTSRFLTDGLQPFRESLKRFEKERSRPARIPLLCYAPSALERPSNAELSRYRIDACLPEDFDAIAFSRTVAGLASGVAASAAAESEDHSSLLPVFKAEEFREQVSFDSELILEIIDLFLQESEKQVAEMRSAFQSGDLLALSRIAHNIKGSLGSLYAMQSTARAQTLEQVAKAGDRDSSERALSGLEADLQTLKPELIQLRKAESGS